MLYGICNLSMIPMRSHPSHQSEMINQILFGEFFIILKEKDEYSLVRLNHDSYEGWVCNNQWVRITENDYKILQNQTPTITTDIIDVIKKEKYQPIVIGSILPNFKSNHASIDNKLYTFNGLTTQGYSQKKHIVENAHLYIDAPYLWGGRSPLGIDCSGFVQMVYRLQGISLPRDAYEQVNMGTNIDSIDKCDPGDLAFFINKERKVVHVGIIMSRHKIIHASGKVRIDKIDKNGIYNEDNKVYTHKLHLLKRIF